MSPRAPMNCVSVATVEACVEAASILIDEAGWEDLAIRDVAIRAGVRPGSVHRYFTDREGIAAALVARDRGTYAYRLRASGLTPNVIAHMLDRDPAAVISLCCALDQCNRESAWDAPVGYLPARGA